MDIRLSNVMDISPIFVFHVIPDFEDELAEFAAFSCGCN
jgi:hypothetical protein